MHNFKKIYCVEKTTLLERISRDKKSLSNMQKSPLQKRIEKNHKNHNLFMEIFKKILLKKEPKAVFIKDSQIKKIHPRKNDLVISCGGDGNFLSCAQNYLNATFLGINTTYIPQDPVFGSQGALTNINKENLSEKWQKFLNQDYSIQNWKRLSASINGKKLKKYAVNDIYIGNQMSYLTCFFSLQTPEHTSEFFCSGVLTCTGVGSNAWFRNAGGNPFAKNLNAFSYLVLTPQAKTPPARVSEILAGGQKIKLRILKDKMVVCLDSREIFFTRMGDEVEIFLESDNFMPVIQL